MNYDEQGQLKGKKCLVTGSNGFVGSHLVDKLLADGATVRALVRKTSNLRYVEGKDVEFVYGELRDPETLPPILEDIDYVFHVAGVVRARKPEMFFTVNTDGSAALFEACSRTNNQPKVVFVSSLAAAGPSGTGPALTEENEPHPISYYGKSKCRAEEIAASYADKLPIAIVRPPIIYGPRETDIFTMFKAVADWRIATLAGNPDAPLSAAHVDDVVQGLMKAATAENSAGNTYFVCGQEDTTVKGLLDHVQKAVGKSAFTFRVPTPIVKIAALLAEGFAAVRKKPSIFNRDKVREIMAGGWACTCEKARREIGFEPQVNLDEGMKSTYEWYKAEGWLK